MPAADLCSLAWILFWILRLVGLLVLLVGCCVWVLAYFNSFGICGLICYLW